MRGHLTVVVLCCLTFWVGAAQAATKHQTYEGSKPLAVHVHAESPLRYAIVSVQPTPDADTGKAEADLASQAGFNALRLIMPWSYPWQHDAKNDKDRICSVAAEAATLHMGLFLDLTKPDKTKPKPPVTSTQISQYNITLGAYMSYLIGPQGCAPGLSELDIEVWNEPDYSRFWPQATAPEDYTHLLIRSWRFVHQEVAKQGYSVPVQVVGGELASSHHPADFIARMEAEALRWKVHGPFFDRFAYHCYGTNGLAVTGPDEVRTALAAFNADSVPLLCTEYAVPGPSAQQFCQAEAMGVNNGLAGFGWFRLLDDPSGLQTGLYNYDQALGQPGDQPTAKIPSLTAINSAAQSGQIACA